MAKPEEDTVISISDVWIECSSSLRAALERIRLLHHAIDARSRVLRALQTAVVNSMHDAARCRPQMLDAVALFEGTLTVGGSLRLSLASALTTELIGKVDTATTYLDTVCRDGVDHHAVFMDADLRAKIQRVTDVAASSVELHADRTALILELADAEIDHLRSALVEMQFPTGRAGTVRLSC